MACLSDEYPDDEQMLESWFAWSYEFMRRGLKPISEIEVHGPHGDPANLMWGTVECEDVNGESDMFQFATRRPCHSIWQIKGVKIKSETSGEEFPLIPRLQLPSEWRKEMAKVKRQRWKLRHKNL